MLGEPVPPLLPSRETADNLCQCGCPQRNLPEKDILRLGKQLEEMDKEMMVSSLQPPHFALSLLNKDGCNSLHTKGQIGDKSYIVTIDTGATVTIARPDITAELPERDPP